MSGRHLQRWIGRMINHLLSPGLCLACGCEIHGRHSLCCSCRQLLKPVPTPCLCCAQPNPVAGQICPACLLNPPRWQRMIAPLQYHGVTRDYLIQLKYAEATHLARTLAEPCIAPLRLHFPSPEVLLPVPLHRERLLERGYNQASEIAGVWATELDIGIDHKALTRIRATPSQAGLSASQRAVNLRRAFHYAPPRSYRHVAIIDDVVTTGSTVDEITRTLHRGGVEYVEVWALARAYRH